MAEEKRRTCGTGSVLRLRAAKRHLLIQCYAEDRLARYIVE